MSSSTAVPKGNAGRDLPRSLAALAVVVIVMVAVFVSPLVSSDYWDWGPRGLALTMLVGWVVVTAASLRANRRQPWLVALLAVGPWALGLGGMAYIGFLFLPLEVTATTLVLRRVYRGTPLTARQAVRLAVLARSLACVPLLL